VVGTAPTLSGVVEGFLKVDMFELKLLAPQIRVEALSDVLEALDALSVSVEDADAHTPAERALFGEPDMPAPEPGWNRSRVTALFETRDLADVAADALTDMTLFEGCEVQGVTELEDQDWVRLTQSQFTPVEITPDFWIVPTWHEPPMAARTFLRLDPGLAFGTGTHPTTRMCLRWIAQQDMAKKRTLDYGCGSGILAMAAFKFGATDIDAVDIDPAAVTSTDANATVNCVTLRSGLPDVASGQYQVVLANILATPLKLLAPLLCGHVASQGHLVLAGILSRQVDELKAAYAPYLALSVLDESEGWVLMGAHAP
jgi:ribosomal protein L11 methyltransferase